MATANSIASVLEKFPNKMLLAEEILRLRELREKEEEERIAKLPKIRELYAVKQSMHDNLYYLSKFKPGHSKYFMVYVPVDKE